MPFKKFNKYRYKVGSNRYGMVRRPLALRDLAQWQSELRRRQYVWSWLSKHGRHIRHYDWDIDKAFAAASRFHRVATARHLHDQGLPREIAWHTARQDQHHYDYYD